MRPDKHVTQVRARHIASDTPVSGYEIHIGESDGPDRARPVFDRDGAPEGAISADGRAMGSYLHGLFGEDAFRRAFLAQIGAPASDLAYGAQVDATLDALADHLEAHCDCDGLLAVAQAGAAG
jgi:adenosylcobyric acid synthase